MGASVFWFRRDLRLADNPGLLTAIEEAGDNGVVPLFVLDDRLRAPAGPNRLAFLSGCLARLDDALGGRLVVRSGRPADVVPAVAAEVDAASVHAAADFGPYGRRRDAAVADALSTAGRRLELVGSPYAVDPGRVRKKDGTPFRVFSPFFKAWTAHGWDAPVRPPKAPVWLPLAGDGIPPAPPTDARLPEPGEEAARRTAKAFFERLADYGEARNDPAADATSRLSPYLKWGCVHPRQLLAAVARHREKGAGRFRFELAWREFYADVLLHHPETVHQALQPQMRRMETDEGADADTRFAAWAEGRTGYPIVDAGMRQLRTEGWMHNRVRMITASFLVKDLHLDWSRGAGEFLHHLVDGDLASNHHGWQWVAGTGTDPAPYFRVFNPVLQGEKFDPDGAYVRRHVPELADLTADVIHHPWDAPGGSPPGYPAPIVDHDAERREALTRYDAVRAHRD